MTAIRQGRVRVQAAHSSRPQPPPARLGGAAWSAHAGPHPHRHHRLIGAGAGQQLVGVVAVRWARMACRSAWLSGRTDPLGRSRRRRRATVENWPSGCSFPGGASRRPAPGRPATLLAEVAAGWRARWSAGGRGCGRQARCLAWTRVDGRPGSLPVGPLCSVGRLRAEGPHRIGDAVGVPVLLDLGGGLSPGPPTPGRLGHRPQRLQDIAGTVGFDRHAGGATLPGQGPHHLPILRAEVGVGLQPAVADAAGAGAALAPGHEPGWPAGWPPPTHPGIRAGSSPRRSQRSMPAGW